MKANEVRLNNYVIYKNEVYEIDTIAKGFPTLKTGRFGIGVVDWNNIKSVPLTEKWLINLGAKKCHRNFEEFFIHDRFMLQWINGHNYWYVTDANFGSYITKIEFLHEWQNLFFTLIQKELTL